MSRRRHSIYTRRTKLGKEALEASCGASEIAVCASCFPFEPTRVLSTSLLGTIKRESERPDGTPWVTARPLRVTAPSIFLPLAPRRSRPLHRQISVPIYRDGAARRRLRRRWPARPVPHRFFFTIEMDIWTSFDRALLELLLREIDTRTAAWIILFCRICQEYLSL